jgi:hypothetical protein
MRYSVTADPEKKAESAEGENGSSRLAMRL